MFLFFFFKHRTHWCQYSLLPAAIQLSCIHFCFLSRNYHIMTHFTYRTGAGEESDEYGKKIITQWLFWSEKGVQEIHGYARSGGR